MGLPGAGRVPDQELMGLIKSTGRRGPLNQEPTGLFGDHMAHDQDITMNHWSSYGPFEYHGAPGARWGPRSRANGPLEQEGPLNQGRAGPLWRPWGLLWN